MKHRFPTVGEAMQARGILGRWYADPLGPACARARLRRARDALQKFVAAKRPCLACRLEIMIARHSLGRPIDRDYHLAHKLTAGSAHGRALTELIYGQLLMSAKLAGAREHLTRGFESGCHLFGPRDYFIVSKRHKLLNHLVLTTQPAPPATLRQLLTEAAVIRRLVLSAGGTPRYVSDPRDTVG